MSETFDFLGLNWTGRDNTLKVKKESQRTDFDTDLQKELCQKEGRNVGGQRGAAGLKATRYRAMM